MSQVCTSQPVYQSPKLLQYSMCYLIGPIDRVKDYGIGWRREIIKKCNETHKLGITFLDPTNKVRGMVSENQHEQERIAAYKMNGQWDELSKFMRKVVREDNKCVDNSDFVICYIDNETHMCGSYFELHRALAEETPYFIISPNGKQNLPTWLFGVCNHQLVFQSIDEVVDMLCMLDDGSVRMDDNWVLTRKQIKELG